MITTTILRSSTSRRVRSGLRQHVDGTRDAFDILERRRAVSTYRRGVDENTSPKGARPSDQSPSLESVASIVASAKNARRVTRSRKLWARLRKRRQAQEAINRAHGLMRSSNVLPVREQCGPSPPGRAGHVRFEIAPITFPARRGRTTFACGGSRVLKSRLRRRAGYNDGARADTSMQVLPACLPCKNIWLVARGLSTGGLLPDSALGP